MQLSVEQAIELAGNEYRAGRVSEAEALCRGVLGVQAEHPGALHLLGFIAASGGRLDVGVELVRRAVAGSPGQAGFLADLGILEDLRGNICEAVDAYQRAVEIQPDLAGVHCNLGGLLRRLGRYDESIEASRRAIALAPNLAEAYGNLGTALNAAGKLDEAVLAYREAIRLKPDVAGFHFNLGNDLKDANRGDEAIVAYREAIRLDPKLSEAYKHLAFAMQSVGDVYEAVACSRRGVEVAPGDVGVHQILLFTMNFHPEYNAGRIAAELKSWNERHAAPLKQFVEPHANDRDPDRRLRVGYVSADFYDHACAYFMIPLFRHHDRNQVELFCYCENTKNDKTTAQIRELVPNWRTIHGRSDAEVAGMVRGDKIDILVDLKLHTWENRLLVFARKPAPVQVSWLGYPGSTGMEAMDYRLTDPWLDPEGADDGYYAEKSIRLPDTFWCYDPLRKEPGVNELPCLRNHFTTFGFLNQCLKMNDRALSLWARVLHSVPGSRLKLLAPEGMARQRILGRLGADGIEAGRVEFVPLQGRRDYLREYHGLDIGVDALPYNGHTSSLDSLWMGVPVVTLVGKTAVGRAGASQLTNLGLTELIARDEEAYVRIVRELAGDIGRLKALRAGLRERMEGSALMDGARFARNIEKPYREMWKGYLHRG
jgi:protein O-GlcNAc transferase